MRATPKKTGRKQDKRDIQKQEEKWLKRLISSGSHVLGAMPTRAAFWFPGPDAIASGKRV